MHRPQRSLRPLFAPQSVAVLGASNDPAKWGYVLAQGALRGAGRRPVYLVNRAGGEILGVPAYRSLDDLPDAPELVVVSVPEPGFEDAVEQAIGLGARAIVAITAGLAERSEEGRRREAAVVERVRAAGAVMLGPNCLGVYDAGEELDVGWSALPPGPIGLISQSGNLALELAQLASAGGLGFSRFASLGNQADLVAADLVDEITGHDATRVVALYMEDFRDGRAFVAAAARAVAAGKPVILLTGGVSHASAAAALSHTGALVSDARAIEAACRAAGIASVATPKQLVDAAQALLPGRLPRGRRIGVYADGGGHGVVATDVVAAFGLAVPSLSVATSEALTAQLPATASTQNPVDFAGGERSLATYATVGRTLVESGEIDAVLLTGYFGGYCVDTPERGDEELETARALGEVAAASGMPLVVHTSYPASAASRELRAAGVPTYGDVESAVAALRLLAEHAEALERVLLPPALDTLPPVPPPAPGYAGARAFVASAGVPMSSGSVASTPAGAVATADEIGYPVVLKAADLLHKSDAGGVVLGLADADAVLAAASDLVTRLGTSELAVERMAPVSDGVELIVGGKRDPRFGPLVLVGLGGVLAEVLDDVAVALAPVAEAEAEWLVRSLHGAAVLAGVRGRPAVDIAAAARAVAALSRAFAACPALEELDVNPLLVLPDGAVALDARTVLAG
jgi:acyl-CoA synthetase (NDP forming)